MCQRLMAAIEQTLPGRLQVDLVQPDGCKSRLLSVPAGLFWWSVGLLKINGSGCVVHFFRLRRRRAATSLYLLSG